MLATAHPHPLTHRTTTQPHSATIPPPPLSRRSALQCPSEPSVLVALSFAYKGMKDPFVTVYPPPSFSLSLCGHPPPLKSSSLTLILRSITCNGTTTLKRDGGRELSRSTLSLPPTLTPLPRVLSPSVTGRFYWRL